MNQYLYNIFNKDTGRVKIGISNSVKNRLNTLRTESGCTLEISYQSEKLRNAYVIEQLIHKELSLYRHIGEWFNVNKDYAKEISIKICNRCGLIGEYYDAKALPLNFNNYTKIIDNIYRDKENNKFHIIYKNNSWIITTLNTSESSNAE